MKSKQNRKTNTKNIVILSITLALIIILQLFAALLQQLGMPMSLALGLIPVLVISQTHGIKFGSISGLFFGLFTLIFSVIYMAAVPMYKVTANPLVSVFPRIMVGVVCALSYGGFMGTAKRRDPNPTLAKKRVTTLGISAASTVFGVLTNTILFLAMFFAFAHGKTFDNLTIDFRWVLSSIVALNTVIELVVFAIVVPPIVYAMTESKLATKLFASPAPETEKIADEDNIDCNASDTIYFDSADLQNCNDAQNNDGAHQNEHADDDTDSL